MKAGRKNLKRVSHEEEGFSLQEGQSIMQVVSLRGSNIIEVMDAEGVKSLALFPAKFHKRLWIKRGSFVVVDENGRKEALDSGSKVACMVSQVIFHNQVRALQKCSECCPVQWILTIEEHILELIFLVPPYYFEAPKGVNMDCADCRAHCRPETFRTTLDDDSSSYQQIPAPQSSVGADSDEEDGVSPLEANLNRSRPVELYSDSDNSDTDTVRC